MSDKRNTYAKLIAWLTAARESRTKSYASKVMIRAGEAASIE